MLDIVYKKLVLDKGYVPLFKAAIYLFVGATVVFGNFLFFIYEKEMVAYEKKYEIESILKKSLDSVKCGQINHMEAECFFVKHQIDVLNSLSNVCQKVLHLLLYLGTFSLLMSVAGFCCELIFKPKCEVRLDFERHSVRWE